MNISVNNAGTRSASAVQMEADDGDQRRAEDAVVMTREQFEKRAVQKRKLAHFESAAHDKRIVLTQMASNRQSTAQTARSERRERPEARLVRKAERSGGADEKKLDAVTGIEKPNHVQSDLEEWLVELCDEYEQHMKQYAMTEEEMARFKEDNAESIQAGIDTAALFQESQPGAFSAIDRFRAIYRDGKNGAVPSPLKMVESLVAKFGNDMFLRSMKALRMEIGASFRSRTTAGGLGRGGIGAYQMGAVFHLIQSAASVASRLRAALCEAGIMARGDQVTLVMALLDLGEGGQSQADHLVDAAVERRDVLSTRQQAGFYRLVGDAVNALPTTLWAPNKLALRLDLLAELERRMKREHERIAAMYAGPDAQLESKLRRQLAGSNQGTLLDERVPS